MQLTRHGHSCVLVETAGKRVLLDPGNMSGGSWHGLEGLDAVLVTHQHPDHLDVDALPALLAANPGVLLVTEPEVAAALASGGEGPSVEAVPLSAGGTADLGGGLVVEAVGGVHATIHDDIPLIGNVGLVLRAEGEPSFFHPGDSYASAPDGVDVVAVPLMAPWGALKEAVEFTRSVRAGISVPIHDGLLVEPAKAMYRGRVADLGGSRFVDLPNGELVTL